jgi:hypothetical protein
MFECFVSDDHRIRASPEKARQEHTGVEQNVPSFGRQIFCYRLYVSFVERN